MRDLLTGLVTSTFLVTNFKKKRLFYVSQLSYLRACEVLPQVQNLINSINNVDEITGDIRTKLEELYHHYSKILRNEKAEEIQNFEDDLAEYYLPAGIHLFFLINN